MFTTEEKKKNTHALRYHHHITPSFYLYIFNTIDYTICTVTQQSWKACDDMKTQKKERWSENTSAPFTVGQTDWVNAPLCLRLLFVEKRKQQQIDLLLRLTGQSCNTLNWHCTFCVLCAVCFCWSISQPSCTGSPLRMAYRQEKSRWQSNTCNFVCITHVRLCSTSSKKEVKSRLLMWSWKKKWI